MQILHFNLMHLLLACLIWLAAAVRFHGLFTNTFHADEALFASWARLIGVWRDPLLATQPVDKPPLLFYLQALFLPLMGTAAPWVARLPGLIASILLVPLVSRLVWQLYADRLASVMAATFVALSPLSIQFSATGFIDPLLSFFLLLTLVFASHPKFAQHMSHKRADYGRNALYVGLLFGLATATKHQAWLFLPLLASLALIRGWRGHLWSRWFMGALPVLLILVAWSAVRGGNLSLWSLQLQHYGGLRLAWSWELWSRLEAWGQLWATLVGSPIMAFFLLLALPIFLALLISEQDTRTAYDQLFVIFVVGYGLLHWFVAVPVWDRYLLPLVPIAGVLLGRFVSRVLTFIAPTVPVPRKQLSATIFVLLFLLLLPGAAAARRADYPVGGQPQASAGAKAVAAALANEPYGTVLYDHWYSWHWRYHLFDSKIYVSWFPDVDSLLRDLDAFGHRSSRYLVLPATGVSRPIVRSVLAHGYSLEVVYRGEEMILYQLKPRES